MKRMLIVGGTGETGSWFARYFRDRGFLVQVWGPSGKRDVAEALGVDFAPDVRKAAAKCDVMLISVPIQRTAQVVMDLAPLMQPGALLMDVTSLKSEAMSVMSRYAPPGVEVLGTHPMFGPTVPAILGQTVILIPVHDRGESWLPVIRELFIGDGARVEVMGAEEHDEMMAVVQALTHFAYLSIGSTLQALQFDVTRSRRFMSPVYDIMLDFVGRILDQSPELYAMIQSNPAAAQVRRTFIDQAKKLGQAADAGDTEEFCRMMQEAARHFGKTHEALVRSDRIINQRAQEKTSGR